jgi:hypothetical protein
MKKDHHSATSLAVLTVIVVVCVALMESAAWAAAAGKKKFTTDFLIADCTFSNDGRNNPYFSLEPGDQLVLADGNESVEITVLNQTQMVMGVNTRVIRELEMKNGNVVETSLNFFARCTETNDIYYFGEEVDPPAIGGAWLAGVDGAVPGIIMPGTFLLGSRYFQEQAPGVALDRAEHTKMGLTFIDPKNAANTFENCVEVVETTKLERGKSKKRYCPGIGLVFDDGLELIDYTP